MSSLRVASLRVVQLGQSSVLLAEGGRSQCNAGSPYCVVFLPLTSVGIRAADSADPENFRIEITGSTWLIDTTGNVQSRGTPLDFVSDLGFEQQRPVFYGKLVFKPGRKHRVPIEGSLFRFDGNNTIHRSIIYQGQTFNIDETLKTTASLDYLFARYRLLCREVAEL